MKLPTMSAGGGIRYVVRGLLQGRRSSIVIGVLIIIYRLVMGKRRRAGPSVTVKLAPGDAVGLRVSRPGDDPTTFGLR